MKKAYFLILCLAPLIGISQEIPRNPDTGKFEYYEEVQISIEKDTLYFRAKEWAIQFFKNENLKYDRNYDMVASGSYDYSYTGYMGVQSPVPLKYEIEVLSKDKKYSYRISNFSVSSSGTELSFEGYLDMLRKKKLQEKAKEPIGPEMERVIASLKKFMEEGILIK